MICLYNAHSEENYTDVRVLHIYDYYQALNPQRCVHFMVTYSTAVGVFPLKPQIWASWWLWIKSQRITKRIWVYRLEIIRDVCKIHVNLSDSYWDISVWTQMVDLHKVTWSSIIIAKWWRSKSRYRGRRIENRKASFAEAVCANYK